MAFLGPPGGQVFLVITYHNLVLCLVVAGTLTVLRIVGFRLIRREPTKYDTLPAPLEAESSPTIAEHNEP
jgi:hypothetical protein